MAHRIAAAGILPAACDYDRNWGLPVFDIYKVGIGSPIFLSLNSYSNGEFEPYTTVTVNLPDCNRGAGCQFIDTNSNGKRDAGLIYHTNSNKSVLFLLPLPWKLHRVLEYSAPTVCGDAINQQD